RVDVGADDPEQQAQDDHADGAQQRTVRQHDGRDQAQHHQGEVLRGAELERDFGQRRRRERDQEGGYRTGEEGTQRRDRQSLAGIALARHLVAVQRRDDGGGFAWQIDQDRGGGTAILRAVVNTG